MNALSWVEISLLTIFAATFLLSVSFCFSNYAENGRKLAVLRRVARIQKRNGKSIWNE